MKKTNIQDVKSWIKALENGEKKGNLTCPLFLKPYHLVTLALMLKKQHAKWLELSEEIESYALRMGLWQAADIIPPYEMIAYPTQNKFLPVAALTDLNTINTVAKNLTHLIYQNEMNSSFQSMETILIELIENTYKHANVQSSMHGLVCAQSWPKGNLAQIVFADAGIGIRNSLRENSKLHTQLSQVNACQLACDLGITSKPKGPHTGYGLALTRDLMKQCHGTMMILSFNEGYLINAKEDLAFEIPNWQGSLIILEWSLDYPLAVNQVYASWPIPEGFEEDDFS